MSNKTKMVKQKAMRKLRADLDNWKSLQEQKVSS